MLNHKDFKDWPVGKRFFPVSNHVKRPGADDRPENQPGADIHDLFGRNTIPNAPTPSQPKTNEKGHGDENAVPGHRKIPKVKGYFMHSLQFKSQGMMLQVGLDRSVQRGAPGFCFRGRIDGVKAAGGPLTGIKPGGMPDGLWVVKPEAAWHSRGVRQIRTFEAQKVAI